MKIIRIHHLTVAVRDLAAARATFAALIDVTDAGAASSVPAFGIRTAALPLGEDVLRLAAPESTDNPLMRFLERRGEGLYNVALEVDDLDAAVRELAAKGVRVSEPVLAEPGLRSAFVTMAATHGLSIQLVEVPAREQETATAPTAPEPIKPGRRAAPKDAAAPPDTEPQSAPPPAAAPLDLTPDEWSDFE